MKGFLLILTTIFLTSCGERFKDDVVDRDIQYKIFAQTNDTFNVFTESYKTEATNFNISSEDIDSIPINFYDLDNLEGTNSIVSRSDNHHIEYKSDYATFEFETDISEAQETIRVGVCIKYNNGDREILINKEAWDTFSDAKKEILIYHELGHCSLNRNHDDSLFNNKKTSVMHSILLDENLYNNYNYEYLLEFFTSDKTEIYRSFN